MKEFSQLVTVKVLREEKAERTLHAQRRVLQEAEAGRDAASHRLDDYRNYAQERERRIYQDLCERVVRLRDIEDVQGQVQMMRARESDHRDELAEAEQRRAREAQQLTDDQSAHRLALRVRDKFVDLGDQFASEARASAERAEEDQIEEAAETRRPGALMGEPA